MARLLLPLAGWLVAAAGAAAPAPTPAPTPPDQRVLAANRQGIMKWCFDVNSLDADLQTKLDAFGARREGAGEAGRIARKKGDFGSFLQGDTYVDLWALASQMNRPPRFLCDEIADQASAKGPLPAVLQ